MYSAHTRLCKELNVSDNELSKEYNLLLIKAYCSFPNTSMFIEQAIQLIPSKPEPYLLLAFDRVHNRLLKASAFD